MDAMKAEFASVASSIPPHVREVGEGRGAAAVVGAAAVRAASLPHRTRPAAQPGRSWAAVAHKSRRASSDGRLLHVRGWLVSGALSVLTLLPTPSLPHRMTAAIVGYAVSWALTTASRSGQHRTSAVSVIRGIARLRSLRPSTTRSL